MHAQPSRIGILSGGGRLPLMIAESAQARGTGVHIVALEGEADPEVARFPHTWVNWGEVGRILAVLRAAGGEVVIAGAVKRPDLRKLRPDLGMLTNLPLLLGTMTGGDDSVLSRVIRIIEQNGMTVRGAHEVAPDLLATTGAMGRLALGERGLADAALGFAVLGALGAVDAGQAVVVAGGCVLAIEGAEGTDAMLERVAGLRGAADGLSGVLAKGPKPGQEMRVDMPAIGPRTIERAGAARLAGVVVEAGGVLVLDRAEVLRLADASGCAVYGLTMAGRPGRTGQRAGERAIVARLMGRRRPSRRDTRDVDRGLAAVRCLAPFATGAGAVVSRAYVLAIEAGEGTSAMLARAGALRQWGLKGGRRSGVLVRRVDAAGTDGLAPHAALSAAAAQGLAGIAVAGPPEALLPYEEAGRVADSLGLFLIACELA